METRSIVSFTTIASSIRGLSFSLLLAGTLAAPSWGQVKEVEIVRSEVDPDDRVTLRVQVKGEGDRPVMNLKEKDFQLKVKDTENNTDFPDLKNNFDWKSPEETDPPPAWIIILLDMSGSMQCGQNPSSSNETQCSDIPRGKRKLDGAITAIQKFIEQAERRQGNTPNAKGNTPTSQGNTNIAIVPFGKSSEKCSQEYPVTDQELNIFFAAGSVQLTDKLKALTDTTPCSSTNLYESLEAALKFLGDSNDTRFYPAKDSKEPRPRLSIILLSDGHDSVGGKIEDVLPLLEREKQVIVHTLGYGLTPRQLGRKWGLKRAATLQDRWWGEGQPPVGKVPAEEYVDKDGLARIAKPSRGIAAFSARADEVAAELQVFLDALLGEYEISYQQPDPERGKTYEATVTAGNVSSDPEPYWINLFGKAPSLDRRFPLFAGVIATLAVFWVLPFWVWGAWKKRQG